jgi:hypothetical protein
MVIRAGVTHVGITFSYFGKHYELSYVTTQDEIDMSNVMWRVKKFLADTVQRRVGAPFMVSFVKDLKVVGFKEM